jgi:hypothetical protein
MATLSKINSNFTKITVTDGGGNILSLNVPDSVIADTGIFNNLSITDLAVTNISVSGNYISSGISNLGPISNVIITGGANGQYLSTDGTGNLSWTIAPVSNTIVDGSSNVLVYPNSKITFSVSGISNVISLTSSEANISIRTKIDNDVIINGNTFLGSNSNIRLTGGNFGDLLATDGNGGVYWIDQCSLGGGSGGGGGGGSIAGVQQIIAGNNITINPASGIGVVTIDSNLESQPQIQFVATATAPTQVFADANIGTFQDSTYAAVFVNGVLQRPSDYIITGSTLTVIPNLNIGDIIQIAPTGGSGGGGSGNGTPGGANSQIQFNNNGQFGGNAFFTFSNGAITGNTFQERATDLTFTSTIDLNNGAYFYKTITGVTILTVINVPPFGTVGSFILEVTNGGSFPVSFGFAPRWTNGIPPALTISGTDVLGFYTYDNGISWIGMLLAQDVL